MPTKLFHLFTAYIFNRVKIAFVLEKECMNTKSTYVFKLVIYLFFLKTCNLPILSSQIVNPSKELLSLSELSDHSKIKLITRHTRESCTYYQSELSTLSIGTLIQEVFISEPIFFSTFTHLSASLFQLFHSSSNFGILLEQRYISIECFVLDILNVPSDSNLKISYILVDGCIPLGIIVHIHLFTRMWLGWPYEFIHVPISVSWSMIDLAEFLSYIMFYSSSKPLPLLLFNQAVHEAFLIATWSPNLEYNTNIPPVTSITSIISPSDFNFFFKSDSLTSSSIVHVSPFKLLVHCPHLLLSDHVLSKYNLSYNSGSRNFTFKS